MSAPPRLPYPGLRAYERDETDLFFGREGCVNEMIDILSATHFLAVLGTSGSGKSSLVRTGLLDGLELGLYRKAGSVWCVADCHPGGDAIRHLAVALLALRPGAADDAFALESLCTFLRRGPRAIIEWVEDGNLIEGQNLLILVDQFEELFRYGDYAGREEAEAFVALLLESVKAHPRIHVVITMRSEYLGACALIPGLAERINASLYLTRRMTREECREAIEGPAGVMGFDIEPGLVNRLLNELAAFAPWEADRASSQLQRLARQADQLPLMQHTLSRLWQIAWRRAGGGRPTLTLKDYEDIGQLQGAVEQHANEVTERLGDAAKAATPRIFRALVAGSTLADAVRRPMRFGDLCIVTGADPALVREVVNAFRARDCNFLRPPEGHPLDDGTIVDVSHESLIRQWGSLSGWFETEVAGRSLWERLLFDQAEHAAGHAELLSGLDLATALAWWEREQPTPAWADAHGGRYAEIQDFIRKSRDAEEQRTRAERSRLERERRALKRRTAAYAVLAAICVAVAGNAYWEKLQLDRSNAKQAETYKTLHDVYDNLVSSKHQAQASNDQIIATADRFVVGMAKKLLVTPGIPRAQVSEQLEAGQLYLDGLEPQVENRRLLRLTRVRFMAVGARVMLDRGRFDEGLKLAQKAESLLLSGGDSGKLNPDETLEQLEIGSLISEFYDVDALDDLGLARDKALQMVRIADALPADAAGRSLFEQARAHYDISRYVDRDDAAEGVPEASRCIELLRRPGVAKTPERSLYESRCHVVLGYFDYKLGKKRQSVEETKLALDLLERIAPSDKTIPMLYGESRALANLGFSARENKDYALARSYFQHSEKLLDLSDQDIRERPKLRAELVDRLDDIGMTYIDENDRRSALPWYHTAHELAFSDDEWRSYAHLSDAAANALANQQIALNGLAWDTDPELLGQIVEVERDHVALLGEMTAKQKAGWCRDCEIVDKADLARALFKFDAVRKDDRYDEAVGYVKEVVAKAKAVLAHPADEQDAANARRAWYWAMQALPEEIPASKRPEEQLRRLRYSQRQSIDFLQTFPKAWLVADKLGRIDHSLAKVLAGLTRPDEAIAAAESGARLFDQACVKQLADWYRTGSGPVERDLAKAKTYDTLLASRAWGRDSFSVTATARWNGDNTPMRVTVYIENPRDDKDDFVARFFYEYEYIEGYRFAETTKSAIASIPKLASDSKMGYTELTNYAVSDVSRLAYDVHKSIVNDKLDQAAGYVLGAWSKDKNTEAKPAVVADAISKLIGDDQASDFSPQLASIASMVYASGNPRAARAVLDATLSMQKDVKPETLALLLRYRGIVHDKLGELALAEADYAAALSIDPDNAELLNALAYTWVTEDKNLPIALAQLQRAARLAPDNAYIRDSLGWAEVLTGDTETGLATLQSAVASQPEEAEMQAHLGDAFRRLGRKEEARAALSRAEALSKDAGVTAYIRDQQALLGAPTPR
ncbi:tetratricopeptide repeat protein [Scleromatobacter humisilvae]|uniref:Novel STAND NTPase 1 domain-containing protein n=1 Tax=Scleromatobacter humisilvae TaxID=2897159 RepID=A0A9X2C1T1_9BURK|nr:hypothetical protein [Scleromatobacter humisilvae]MCK9686104.1 hypothetical protein [Scleromatobacter humisilvae]